jgi:hypothetical protein
MTPKNYIHPTKLINAITDLAYRYFRSGQNKMTLSSQGIQELGGNPTYLKQYQKMLQESNFTVTIKEPLGYSDDFRLGWTLATFVKLIEADEKEAYKQLEIEKVDAELNQIKYCPVDSQYHTILAVAGKLIQKLLALSTNPSEVLLTEQDLRNLNFDNLDLEELKDTLYFLGVSATLTEYSGIDDQQTTTLLINWHKSTLYHIVNS